jgi:hypothetical protein
MSDLEVQVAVSPDRVGTEDLEGLTVHAVVVNRGNEPVDTELFRSTLLVDGRRNPSWGFAIGNGARDVKERSLPPGERVIAKRVMGRGLVSAPGEHEVVLEVRGVRSPPATVVIG